LYDLGRLNLPQNVYTIEKDAKPFIVPTVKVPRSQFLPSCSCNYTAFCINAMDLK
jgi:hypothetical protein